MFLRNIIVSLFVTVFCLFIYHRCNRKGHVNKWRVGGILLLCMTVVFIYTLTGVTPLSGFYLHAKPGKNTGISLVPFHTIRSFLKRGLSGYVIANLLGNIVMFIPFGFLLPLIFKKCEKWYFTIPAGFALSLLIEFSQLFLQFRGTDVDDLILNTLGTAIGYFLFLPIRFGRTKLYEFFRKPEENPGLIVFLPYSILFPYLVVMLLGFWDRYHRLFFYMLRR